MKAYTLEEIKAEFARLGYQWPAFHLVGIRSKADKPDTFDDWLAVIDGSTMKLYYGTTNPGTPWLLKPLNPKGAAVLKPGQYVNCWTFGKHRGAYEALVQCRPVTVYRDNDKDLKSETGQEDTGLFGINIHRTKPGYVSWAIGKFSAGCQVFKNTEDFDQMLKAARESGQHLFTYTLLTEF